MMSEALRKLAQNLDVQTKEERLGDPFMNPRNYTTYPLKPDNFTRLNLVDSDRTICSIDGGNQEIIGAPNFSVQLIRVYYNKFRRRRRIQPLSLLPKIEFLSLTLARFQEGEIFYETSLFPLSDEFSKFLPEAEDLRFSSVDRRIMVGISRPDIRRVASITRRFAEWAYARFVVSKELQKGDIMVMDGALRTAFSNESKYAKLAYAEADSNGVIYTALSKTSRLFTTTGLSLLGAIRRLALDCEAGETWYYYPIAEAKGREREEHSASMFVAKLNDQSQRVFRYEIYDKQVQELGSEGLNEIFSQLSFNSRDLTFPSYPYGLIDADENARVSRGELEAYRVTLLSEVSKLGSASKFLRQMESSDAHSVLDSIREMPYS